MRVPTGIALLLILLASASCARKPPAAPPPAAPPPRVLSLEIAGCRLVAGDTFVEVRYRVAGGGRDESAPSGMYLLDESTGERFYAMQLQRAGTVSDAHGSAVQTALFKNRGGILRAGSRVTIVAGALRREGVLLEK